MCVNNCTRSLDVLKRVVGLLYPPPKVEPLGLVVPPSLESCQRVALHAPRAVQGARGDFWPPVPQCICSSIRLGKAKPAGEWNNGSLLGPCSQNVKRGLSFQLRELVIGWILRCKKEEKKNQRKGSLGVMANTLDCNRDRFAQSFVIGKHSSKSCHPWLGAPGRCEQGRKQDVGAGFSWWPIWSAGWLCACHFRLGKKKRRKRREKRKRTSFT